MARSAPLKTDESAIPAALSRFIRNRFSELLGLTMLATIAAIATCLATWSVNDPSLSYAVDKTAQNALGYPGAVIADILMQSSGLAVIALLIPFLAWAPRLLAHGEIQNPLRRAFMWILGIVIFSGAFSCLPIPQGWALKAGLGGVIGDIVTGPFTGLLIPLYGSTVAHSAIGLVFLLPGMACIISACNFRPGEISAMGRTFKNAGIKLGSRIAGSTTHCVLYIAGRLHRRNKIKRTRVIHHGQINTNPENLKVSIAQKGRRIIGALFNGDSKPEGLSEGLHFERNEPMLNIPTAAQTRHFQGDKSPQPGAPSRITPAAKPPKPGSRAHQEALSFPSASGSAFELPPLSLLRPAPQISRQFRFSEEPLEQNARILEGVLEDFGIRGDIINVRPGPVVTLYELEPAPGIKSSRIISLADDIARSMSAISARVAVVPGRNAIGIELPNSKRETVFLRELLASQSFEKSKHNLCLALGKNIGGEPIFADLARMPHLLIAGTTGSGKSVGINTMILSLLYKMPPDKCKLIMIDPKMLELSVYEGIPHLLSPVVTDPRKAVVALKWVVREMEERYRNISKMGVRNIDGFNERIAQAQKKGKVLSRTVQTGYDPQTGDPIYEREEMDLQPLPYIVVIIDEMADLMIVAGKDIEGAVQRLAQMARAAGIHVIMATQRPSVDVITGTIKANFPTRISFQVTSKIDSRTILGEMGAEQLLGAGDMLHMAGGGRIVRLHGAFVKDEEVEEIVRHLKAQGAPQYVEAVTEETDDMDSIYGVEVGNSGDELYDKAVAIVIQDNKASTSYVQRRLQIGYNRAATLIEKMEHEGVISQAGHAGKREVLVGGADETINRLP